MMGASFYGHHMVWCSGMSPEEHEKRLAMKEVMKADDAVRDEYRKAEEARIDTEARYAIEGN